MYSKYLPPKTYTKSISLRLSRESTVCLRDSHQAASKKARGLGRRTQQLQRGSRGLGRRTSSCWHASCRSLIRQVFRVPDWSVGARPIDMQVERVRQHHVTELLRWKFDMQVGRVNLSLIICVMLSDVKLQYLTWPAVGAFVGGKRKSRDHRQSSVVVVGSLHAESFPVEDCLYWPIAPAVHLLLTIPRSGKPSILSRPRQTR